MAMERGPLSINSENMFPIIKKWLYSDHDIFYRELISNGCDAITKLKKLDMMGDYELPEGYKARIDIEVDPQEKTIKVTDNGLGMTADEVKEYINNIAFSGAEAFMEKYKDKASDDQIIGHFGLGFYSAFMVAELVEIDTLSWQDGAAPVHWECDGGSTFAMDDGDRKEIGTTVTLHLAEDCLEFANYYRAQEVIEKYCSFMPVEIYLSEHDTKMTETINESERRPEDVVIEVIEPAKKEDEDKDAEPEEKRLKIRRRPVLCNDTNPLWSKTPKDCTDEEYKEFYRKVFHDYKEPLFWIHLNMDYPFNLKGILYFPRINLEYESAEGVIKLYNSQVFIADNIKEVIPEFLMLLKGVIDCPDLPLNVSRSALQNDGFAQKISDYISKKVAEKLAGMCKTDKENYDKLVCLDISEFMVKSKQRELKDLLLEISHVSGNFNFVFRVPYIEPHELKKIEETLSDILFIKTFTIPPFSDKEIRQYAERMLDPLRLEMEEDAWEVFFARIREEKSDGRFYGLRTVKKVFDGVVDLDNFDTGNEME